MVRHEGRYLFEERFTLAVHNIRKPSSRRSFKASGLISIPMPGLSGTVRYPSLYSGKAVRESYAGSPLCVHSSTSMFGTVAQTWAAAVVPNALATPGGAIGMLKT